MKNQLLFSLCFEYIIDSYIDSLITRAYNSLPEYRVKGTRKDGVEKQNDEEYIKLKNI